MNRRRVTAIHEVDVTVLEIEAGVAHGHETFELNQLPRDLRVGHRHDVFRFGECAGWGQRDQSAERLQKVALRGRTEQGGRDPFAHDVSDDDVEAVVAVLEEIVEVAVDALRWNSERGDTHARHVSRRLVEKQGLLDLEADLDFLLARACELLLRLFALGDVFGDADEILRRAVGAEHGHFDGVQIAEAPMCGLDGLFGDLDHPAAVEHGAVFRDEEVRLFLGKEVVIASSDCRAAIDAERLFLRPVPANELQVLGVLDEEHDRQIFQHRVEKTPRIFELSRPLGQRFFHALLFGRFAFHHARGSALGARGLGSSGARRARARESQASHRAQRRSRHASTTARGHSLAGATHDVPIPSREG